MSYKITRRFLALLAVFALVLGLAACGDDKDDAKSDDKSSESKDKTTTTKAGEEGVKVEDAWARMSPKGVTMGAAYMKLTSAEDDKLVKADASEVAGMTQIHEMVPADGKMDGGMTGTTMAGGDHMTTTTMAEGGDMSTTTMAEGGDMATTTTAMGLQTPPTTMGGDMGSMKMQEVKSIELPAGKTVELKPGGYHIMLMELKQPLKEGEKITITLTFEKAGEQTVTVPVKAG